MSGEWGREEEYFWNIINGHECFKQLFLLHCIYIFMLPAYDNNKLIVLRSEKILPKEVFATIENFSACYEIV